MRYLILLAAWAAMAAADPEVRTVEWGIAGTVRGDGFAPLWVLVANPGPEPIDALIELVDDPVSADGVPQTTELHLDPGRERWLRFAPWLRGEDDQPELLLRRRRGPVFATLPKPRFGPPGCALLVGDGDPPRRALLPTLPSARFPDSPGLLDALGCLVVDAPPRLDPGQAAALAAWVRSGGTLVLIPGIAGRTPDPAQAGPGLAVGANGCGRVLVGAEPRERTGLDALAGLGWRPPAAAASKAPTGHRWQLQSTAHDLAGLTTPNHPWGWISLVLIVFSLAVGPAAWIAGRRALDWRVINLAILAAIIAASLLLSVLGRRGYDEQAVWRSLLVAHVLDAGSADVSEQAAIFVTASAERMIVHPSPRNLYACPAESSPVEGAMIGAAPGALATAIPQFTTRHLVHRGLQALRPPAVAGDGQGWTIAAAQPPTAALLWRNGRLFRMLASAGGRWTPGAATDIDSLAHGGGDAVGGPVLEVASRNLPNLVRQALRGPDSADTTPSNCLLVLAPASRDFAPAQGLDEPFDGAVLWRIDLPDRTSP